MNLSEQDVLQILKLIEESSFDSLQLEYGDVKLAVSKSGALMPSQSEPVQAKPAPAPPASPAPSAAPEPKAAPVAEAVAETPAEVPDDLVAVKAPVVGVFYSAPEPGAPPFVSVGSDVESDTTVGLVEVMKVFNGVQAGLKGKIAKILVEDAQLVEYGQPLLLVEPAGEGS